MRVLNEVDARRVDMVVGRLDVRVLGGDLVEGPLPQTAGELQNVGLVNEREVFALARGGEFEAVSDASFNAEAGVERALRGDLL